VNETIFGAEIFTVEEMSREHQAQECIEMEGRGWVGSTWGKLNAERRAQFYTDSETEPAVAIICVRDALEKGNEATEMIRTHACSSAPQTRWPSILGPSTEQEKKTKGSDCCQASFKTQTSTVRFWWKILEF
jgi:hypothetical protein